MGLDPQRLESLHAELGKIIAEEERSVQEMPPPPDRIRVKHADMAADMQKSALDIASKVCAKIPKN